MGFPSGSVSPSTSDPVWSRPFLPLLHRAYQLIFLQTQHTQVLSSGISTFHISALCSAFSFEFSLVPPLPTPSFPSSFLSLPQLLRAYHRLVFGDRTVPQAETCFLAPLGFWSRLKFPVLLMLIYEPISASEFVSSAWKPFFFLPPI